MQAQEYDLALDVDYPSGEFRGTVTVTASGMQGRLELDCEDLSVVEATLDAVPIRFELDPARTKLILEAGKEGGRRLFLRYSGKASHTSLSGLYVSSSGERPVLTTMMEPISCRRVLPCLDTPDQKAVFRVRLTVDPGLTAISNAELERVEPAGGRATWVFAPSPPMATYLLYFGIGPFETEERLHRGVRIIAATLPGKVVRTRTLLELAGPLVHAFGDYYGQPYPLTKLHLVGVPDLWAGAMENWGAIAFPELGILVDDATSPGIRRWAMETLAHEIAHQWFGNLVTMQTFNDLWLNESFATFVAAKMEARLGMRTDAWNEFLIRIRPAYFGDSLESTHPILLDIADPKSIADSTDEITYFKGASVVRMIDSYLGEEVFRSGVAAYLERFRFGNARRADLWASLAAVSGEPVSDVLPAWVERAGLPIVRIRTTARGLHLEQSRFLFSDSHRHEGPWPIPLTLVVGGETRRLVFRTDSLEVPFDRTDSVLVNPGRSAFLRVWYDAALRRQIVRALPAMESADRWAVISDTWAFLYSGDAPLSDYLELVDLGRNFSDYASVLEVSYSLEGLRLCVGESPGFRSASLAFHRAQMSRLSLEARPGEPDTDSVIREQVMDSLARLDDEFAASMAGRMAEIDSLPAAMRPAVAYSYARIAGAEAFPNLYARARSTADEDGAQTAAEALGGLPTRELLTRSLGAAMEPGIRASVAHRIIGSVAENPIGASLVWEWMKLNLRELEQRSSGGWALSRLLERALPVVGIGRREEVEAFFAAESFPEAANGIRKSLEILRITSRLSERFRTPPSG
ncbi:MAG: M1 family metallopeptidase [Thermoplasmata archaeon]|nr:M1 family metallopeptidase [Thermoplasmata archaeon]